MSAFLLINGLNLPDSQRHGVRGAARIVDTDANGNVIITGCRFGLGNWGGELAPPVAGRHVADTGG